MHTAIIILAAGSSSRLGRPKQLLKVGGKSLLQHVIDEAQSAQLSPILVVVGASAEETVSCLNPGKAQIVVNSNWQKGMSTSIISGLAQLDDGNLPKQVIFAVCDQPYISAKVFEQLVAKAAESKAGIVSAAYGKTLGTPVLFSSKYYDELLKLAGDEGARKLIKKHRSDLATINFEGGAFDIDTEADYINYKNTQHD
ncbi:nucleotidyltransferase family protein [Pedobacter sandarakinus]|uniref:nucleotidyltransferase family protein n=1 Tax=Pedobacter sandarakinus TaxID=353156 RepID=UPI0022455D67|nr:nucleotidyltransferase family protein [Pedobacter sandarakinus]MCX2575298.1 nucleotidyltransferase family protein [Pedobacter sandarakinus]